MTAEPACPHFATVADVTPGATGCEECLAMGESWVHLRLCLTCGHVGCCNESPNHHAETHFEETGHPVMRSFEQGEDWMWCYVDGLLVQGGSSRRPDTTVSKEFLRRLSLFAGLSEEDLDRLYGMAKPIFFPAGSVVMEQGAPGEELYVILEGELEVVKRTGDANVLLGLRGVGEVVGEMAVLEEAPRTATVRAVQDTLLLAVSKTALKALLECSVSATLAILRTMTSRLRSQESLLTQQEKMASLGTLAAGLAHELNNPSAAIQRSTSYLHDAIERSEAASADLERAGLDERGREVLERLAVQAAAQAQTFHGLDTLSRNEREDTVQAWLEDHGVPEPWEAAPALVGAGWDDELLNELSSHLQPEHVPTAARWIAAHSATDELIDEVRRSAEAISEIVQGVKSYSYLDQAPVQNVNLAESLESTLVILKHKLKEGVQVVREYGDVPPIEAYGSELNQVWTNLIDNAIDAMAGDGVLTVRTRAEREGAVVEIEDNGPGIPADKQQRIFDIFYTTKPQGVGSGLGLHIVYNIVVHKHRGRISVESRPGRTVFRVELRYRITQ
jgi:signal transduction histidine kinase